MEISLRPSTADRIRAALGDDVDLSPGAVPTVLARLAVEAPGIYSDVLTEISGSQIRLDSERELQRRRRRGLLRRALFWWGEYESEAGDRLVAKRHVAAAVPFGLAALILIMLAVSSTVGHRAAPTARRLPARASTPAVRGEPGHAARRVPAPPSLVPAPASADLLIADPKTPAAPLPTPPLPPAWPWVPSTAGPESPGNPVVFSRVPAPRSADPAGIRPDAAGPRPPVVYDRGEALVASRADSDRPAGPALDTGDPARAAGPSVETPQVGAALVVAGAPGATRWTTGQRVQARLATGVVVVADGPPVPVVAESAEPKGIWLGHASLGPEGLVQVAFTLAAAGASAAVRGVALDPARLAPGLPGRTALRHPQAAGAVAAAALQAAADYAQALARQGQVTLVDGWAQLASGSPAPAWAYVAARLAAGLDPRGAAGGPVATTEIDPGTPLVILLTEAP